MGVGDGSKKSNGSPKMSVERTYNRYNWFLTESDDDKSKETENSLLENDMPLPSSPINFDNSDVRNDESGFVSSGLSSYESSSESDFFSDGGEVDDDTNLDDDAEDAGGLINLDSFADRGEHIVKPTPKDATYRCEGDDKWCCEVDEEDDGDVSLDWNHLRSLCLIL